MYRAIGEDLFVLYSVGLDGRDDGGLGDDVTTPKKGYDCSAYGFPCGPSVEVVGALIALALLLLSALVGLTRGIRKLARSWAGNS